MSGLVNYVSCAALWLGLLVKAPDLIRHRGDPYLRAICAVLALAGLCFFLGAPPTVGTVNRLTGAPNLAAPLTYASITAYSAASQVLIVYWRGGPRVHRTARRWVVGYVCVVIGIATTFALGDAPVERRTDFDTYYATTPYIAHMIVLYLVGHLAAVGVTTVSALRWARQVRGPLRVGLTVLGIGTLCNAGYSVAKLVAVGAHWSGRDWSVLATGVSPAAAGLGALITVTGVLIPLAGPHLADWRRARRMYTRLAPLERELSGVLTARSLRLPRPRFASPTTRLMWRQTSIHNALSYLDAHLDRSLYERTRQAVLRETDDPDRAEAAAWAAIVATAVPEAAARPAVTGVARGGGEPPPLPVPGPGVLAQVADALNGSARAARERGAATPTGAA
ncbi:MAB_1171c family putative transporter [Streptomyces sp. HMX87]|uniref:MAB_1171c family putative transporter n=1 Tax=Streptomyces sp. HMX87 TaxID=3390849 RepID=UPI003A83C44B